MSERVEAALHELARDVRTPVPDPSLAATVRSRIEEPTPTRPGPRVRWLVAVVVALLLSGLAVSPVGAKVAEWLDFHGVMVRDRDGGLSGTPTVPPEPSTSQTSRATFRPLVSSELGEPDGRTVGADGRLVSMSWADGDGTIRIDQFDAELDPMFWKSSPDAVHVLVGGGDAIWFPTPHEVVVTVEGELETYPPRLAASTLVVPWGGVTVRLEGDLELERAVEIVESLE
jgi:hypothetical protein